MIQGYRRMSGKDEAYLKGPYHPTWYHQQNGCAYRKHVHESSYLAVWQSWDKLMRMEFKDEQMARAWCKLPFEKAYKIYLKCKIDNHINSVRWKYNETAP